jgi:hypothetical protein
MPHVSGLRDNVQRFRAKQSVVTEEKKRGVSSPTFENADDESTDIKKAAGGDATIQEPFETNHNDYRLVHRLWRTDRREKPEGSRVDFRRNTAAGNRLRFNVHIPHGADTRFQSDQLHGIGRNITERLQWDASSFRLKG